MPAETLEARLSALEREMAQIKPSLRSKSGSAEPCGNASLVYSKTIRCSSRR